MKKKNFVLVMATAFMFFALSSCDGKKSKKDKDTDDTEEVTDEDETDEENTDEKDDYLTQDLATFDLRGQVIAVKYTAEEAMEPVTVQFKDNGTLKSIYKFDVEGNVDEGKIDRDSKSRISIISFETEEPWITSLIYEDGSMLPKSSMESNQTGNYTCSTYERDDDGNIVEAKFEESVHGGIVEDHDEYSIKLTDYDSHGNWLLCTIQHGSYKRYYKRTIVYEGEANPYQKEIDEALEGDPVIREFITTMYEHDEYNDYEFLEEHCTEDLLKHLRDNYDYDGDGYAVWMFRTGGQDGKPGSENAKNRIISITKDNAGWYHYQFIDAGWRGENKIRAYVENGKVMIDELERVFDENQEYWQ